MITMGDELLPVEKQKCFTTNEMMSINQTLIVSNSSLCDDVCIKFSSKDNRLYPKYKQTQICKIGVVSLF
jgi:hypothetical protein